MKRNSSQSFQQFLLALVSIGVALTYAIPSHSAPTKELPKQRSVRSGVSTRAAVIDPIYAGQYSVRELGPAPGVPSAYGGLTLQLGNPNVLLIGGGSESASGKIYSIKVVRGAQKRITGFIGTGTIFKTDAAFNDAGLFFGPNSVLFFSRWPNNEIGQFKFGAKVSKKIDLTPLAGSPTSLSGLNIVPFGFSAAGRLKWVTYSGSNWYEGGLVPTAQGTYNLSSVVNKPASTLTGGNGGFSYVTPGSPLFPQRSLLANEYSTGIISAFQVDGNGDPIPATRQAFASGLNFVWGSAIDPVTGDLLVTSWNAGTISVISGFKVPARPRITSFTPTSGSVGTLVTVTGANFTPGSAVRLNGKAVQATIQSPTTLTFQVPSGATTGKISVLGAGIAQRSSAASFTVL